MPELDSPDYWPARRKKVASALEVKGWTRKELARAANVAPKTVSNFLSGDHCSWSTFKSLCKALDVSTQVDEVKPAHDVAKPELGGYTREAYADYLGGYFAYRRSFISRDRILRSISSSSSAMGPNSSWVRSIGPTISRREALRSKPGIFSR